jgi:hypothetical protein
VTSASAKSDCACGCSNNDIPVCSMVSIPNPSAFPARQLQKIGYSRSRVNVPTVSVPVKRRSMCGLRACLSLIAPLAFQSRYIRDPHPCGSVAR